MSQDTTHSKNQTFLVVDDHEAILQGTVPALKSTYPAAEVLTAQDIQMAQLQIGSRPPVLIVLDLSLPEKPHTPASSEVGLHFLWIALSQVFNGRTISTQYSSSQYEYSTSNPTQADD